MAEVQAQGYGRLPDEAAQGQMATYPQTATAGTGAPTAAELAQAGVTGAAALANTQSTYPQTAYPETTYPQTTFPQTTYAETTYPSTVPQAVEPAYPQATAPAAVVPAAPVNNTGISDEQDFSAVSSRESIESDKERMAANRAQYEQIQPTELPQREGGSGPNIVEYAISAPNRLGESIYKRSGVALSNHERACARYATPEDAQQAFLKAGGPQRDSKNLDPDGDGFACFWDPTPFQKVRG
ncbi:hypothetical protein [Defluviimonas salinarum]|uniref:Excalibur calcium-binding domain-containing protein n=1 Tax=Defluviimonas salinarum TaxID=2992147 RepID=A0ABT3J391_9RHOB|nr:hypothetical protein [Defluviimonas salinarum]MCW3782144.1 hypothetical protein [Defluviimonas salinarum]